jgi:hypothetical protein
MSEIILKDPNSPYKCVVNTEDMDVEIHGAFNGVMFYASSGKRLSVSLRDGGFEVLYDANSDEIDTRFEEFK